MSQPVRFLHNTRNPRLRYTVAYSFKKDESGNLNVSWGVAQCRSGSYADPYSRSEGRRIAESRLHKALSGKKPALSNEVGEPVVPNFGTYVVTDAEGLNVGKFVANTFETNRKVVMQAIEDGRYAAQRDLLQSLGVIL